MLRRTLATFCFVVLLANVVLIMVGLGKPVTLAYDRSPASPPPPPLEPPKLETGWSLTFSGSALHFEWKTPAPIGNTRREGRDFVNHWVPGASLDHDARIRWRNMAQALEVKPRQATSRQGRPGLSSEELALIKSIDDILYTLIGYRHTLRISVFWPTMLLLILWGALAYPTVARSVRRRRWRARGQCVECGYSLRGLPGARCPECGAVGEGVVLGAVGQ